MSDFEIERGMQIPGPRPSPGGVLKYPWPDMEPGDSFAVPRDGRPAHYVTSSLGMCGRSWCKRHRPDCFVVTRTIGDVVRVWLLKVEE